MATKTLPKATAAFLLSEGDGAISRETVTLISGQNLAAGTVLGKITASGKYTAHNPAVDPADGSEHAVAVLVAAVDASTADAKALIVNKLAEVDNAGLYWNGITDLQKTTAIAKLAESHVIVR